MRLVPYDDRPDLRKRRHAELSGATFPEYMHHNEPGNLYWGRLYSDFPDFQVALLDGDELAAEAHAVPVPWDGALECLATLVVREGVGTHVEPNVWTHHRV
jgi:hypothetical protein